MTKPKLPRILHPRFIDDTLARAPEGAVKLNALYGVPEGENLRIIADWAVVEPKKKRGRA